MKKPVLDTDLYGITAEEYSLGRSNIEVVKAMIDAGIKIIQYREKDSKSIKERYEECKEIRKLTKETDVTFIINDYIDIAILVGADGIHIGQDDLPIEEVRKLVGPEMIIGLSTHSPEQAQDATRRGADYIGVGPMFSTTTKKNIGNVAGLEYLDYVVKNHNIPLVAIGGIKFENIAEVKKRGAKCICLVTEIVGAQDMGKTVQKIRDILANV
ncbi:MAG: thiamine-phosphate pyrophosphorylase [Peptococcaceae bacterium BICA1-8]|nr:MAG: thiamine-phosphate pyrophosphorylase [Peptococcaceae bacterium BICA1-8]